MIAHYGYKDGSGEYSISIETDKCIACPVGYACVERVPDGAVRDHHRRLRR